VLVVFAPLPCDFLRNGITKKMKVIESILLNNQNIQASVLVFPHKEELCKFVDKHLALFSKTINLVFLFF